MISTILFYHDSTCVEEALLHVYVIRYHMTCLIVYRLFILNFIVIYYLILSIHVRMLFVYIVSFVLL